MDGRAQPRQTAVPRRSPGYAAMSLLLEALKKAELAKQAAKESPLVAGEPPFTRDRLPDITQPILSLCFGRLRRHKRLGRAAALIRLIGYPAQRNRVAICRRGHTRMTARPGEAKTTLVTSGVAWSCVAGFQWLQPPEGSVLLARRMLQMAPTTNLLPRRHRRRRLQDSASHGQSCRPSRFRPVRCRVRDPLAGPETHSSR